MLTGRIAKTQGQFDNAIENFANTILYDKVNCSGVGAAGNYQSYLDQTNTGPWALSGGHFADSPAPGAISQFSYAASAALNSGTLSWLWIKEEVFIVRVSKDIDGVHPCDLDVSGLHIEYRDL